MANKLGMAAAVAVATGKAEYTPNGEWLQCAHCGEGMYRQGNIWYCVECKTEEPVQPWHAGYVAPREPGMPNARVGNIEFYYDSERHDEDSVFFDGSYTGPSELELGGGCNRCGAPDDCYCNG